MNWLTLGVGLIVLLIGAELVVRGATSLARSLGVSSLAVGMTVVAFATSAPEMAINIAASLQGRGGITFGNVLGSNIANVGLILGMTAAMKVLHVSRSALTREMPTMLLATAGMVILANDWMLGRSWDVIDRLDGMILLIGFAAFFYVSAQKALQERGESALSREGVKRNGWIIASVATLMGLGGLGLGGGWVVDGAVSIARAYGVSEALVGITIIAVGTSLPELATSLMAVRSNHFDLAVGNVVGSNVFNSLLVIGISAVIGPVAIPPGGLEDLWVLVAFSAILLPIAATHRRRIVRYEGVLLLFGYMSFIVWRISSS